MSTQVALQSELHLVVISITEDDVTLRLFKRGESTREGPHHFELCNPLDDFSRARWGSTEETDMMSWLIDNGAGEMVPSCRRFIAGHALPGKTVKQAQPRVYTLAEHNIIAQKAQHLLDMALRIAKNAGIGNQHARLVGSGNEPIEIVFAAVDNEIRFLRFPFVWMYYYVETGKVSDSALFDKHGVYMGAGCIQCSRHGDDIDEATLDETIRLIEQAGGWRQILENETVLMD